MQLCAAQMISRPWALACFVRSAGKRALVPQEYPQDKNSIAVSFRCKMGTSVIDRESKPSCPPVFLNMFDVDRF